VGVGAVIFNSVANVFLAKRGREARNKSEIWEFPGGGVEFGEMHEQALVREVMEEYGIAIEVQDLLNVVYHIIPREKQHRVSPTYLCRIKSGTPYIREPNKCDEISWYNLWEIPVDRLTIASKKSL
jgi:8-oxo-dGTP diphosphatase